jgi:gliding motility-associated-like protein
MDQYQTLIRTLFFASVWLPLGMYAQLPPLQPEQDCVNAIPVCQSTYLQPNSYQGEGLNPNEITPGLSCLGAGEKNDVWYIFTVQTTGNVCFSILPNNAGDDYDWAVYDLTNHSCADIAVNPNIEVSCDFAPNLGCGGVTGANGQIAGPCGGQNEPCIPVQAGETYVLNVSNYSSTNFGYTLDFNASTAVIFDNVPPQLDSLELDCGANLNLQFSENVVCSSVDPTDFLITGPTGTHTVTTASGANCLAGGSFEDEYDLLLNPPITTSGWYTVSVVDTVLDNCDNVALFTTDSVFLSFPNLNITASADTLCQGDSVILATVPSAGFSYSWSTGTNGPSTMDFPATTTTYVLSAVDAAGCLHSGTKEIVVNPTPQASFLFGVPTACVDVPLSLVCTGSSAASALYHWNFGTANVISGSGPGAYLISWSTPGLASVSLQVEEQGCFSPMQTQTLNVFAEPTADFLAPNQTCALAPTTIQYNGTASPTAGFNWDFDGGIVLSGSGAGPYLVEWVIPGPKNICLIVSENNCLSQAECKSLMVQANPVVDLPAITDQCLDGNLFQFQYVSGHNIQNQTWDFGDGSPLSTQANPAHSYAVYGSQTVSLTVSDVHGCQSTVSESFTVFPPVEAAFAAAPACEGEPMTFLDQSYVAAPSSLQNWYWELGDGDTATGHVFHHTYAANASYPVSLIVASSDGCRDTVQQYVEVYDTPEAFFTAESNCENLPLSFQDESQFENANLSYQWSFGDGTQSAAVNPSHLFPAYGPYSVKLTLTNDKGCSDTHVETVSVYARPVADFSLESVCEASPVSLHNSSRVPGGGSIENYEWSSGNTTLPGGAHPELRFGQAGEYPVQLIVRSSQGCLDTSAQTITVFPNPRVDFSFREDCVGEPIAFQDQSSIGVRPTQDQITEWQWDFGDGQTSNGRQQVSHQYQVAGNYTVSLKAISDKGCASSLTRDVEVFAAPPVPGLEEDRICFGESALLMTLPGPGTLEVNWYAEPGNGDAMHKGFVYATPPLAVHTTYYVEAVSHQGCVGERVPINAYMASSGTGYIQQSAEVVEIPEARVNFSVGGSLDVVAWDWRFGDGTSSSASAPTHEYQQGGRYEVSLILTTPAGCEVELQAAVEVKEIVSIHIPSAFTPNGDGQNDELFIGTQLLSSMNFQVYNRWGNLVYESHDPQFRWDGRAGDGQMVQEGVYAYQMEAFDLNGRRQLRRGTITILK